MSIALTCGSFEANIRGIDADEFPGTPTAAPEGWITVPLPADFSERVGRVAFAAATDESRPVFQGVALVLNRLNFTMVAADGFRLSLDQMTWDCPEAVGQQIDESGIKWTETSDTELPHLIYIVPAAALTEVGRIAKDSGSPLSMHVDPDGRQVVFTCGPTTVTSALIEGDFPNYHRVPPTNHTTSTVIDRSQLSRAVKMSHIFAKYGADILKVTITPSPNGGAGTVALFARSDEAGDNEAELSAAIEGEPVEIAFSAVYLGQALAAVNGWEQVRLQTGTPSAPGKLEVVGLDDWTHVIMPMHI
jgi:DNA polymerase-3 subunit beta